MPKIIIVAVGYRNWRRTDFIPVQGERNWISWDGGRTWSRCVLKTCFYMERSMSPAS